MDIKKDETINGYRIINGKFNKKIFKITYDYSTGWWEEDSDVLTDDELENIIEKIKDGKYKINVI